MKSLTEKLIDEMATTHAPKTHCPKGHPYNMPGNTYIDPKGKRRCRRCNRFRVRIFRRAKRYGLPRPGARKVRH
jgi:hypothetical protein